MFKIIFSPAAEKFLDKLSQVNRKRILSAVERLHVHPQKHLTRLIGEKAYKFRVGDYRLIVDLDNEVLRILVIQIGHRKNVYKK